MPWKLSVTPEVSAAMVQELGIDPAIRLFQRVQDLLRESSEELRRQRDPRDPARFLVRIRPLVIRTKGGWFDCVFSVDDRREPEVFWLVGFAAEFRALGPI